MGHCVKSNIYVETMAGKNEAAKLAALKMALELQKSVDPKLWEHGAAPKWGNILHKAEMEAREEETSEEKAKREAETAAKREAMAKAANIQKKGARFLNPRTGVLKRIAKMCKWECQGEKCWAHEGKTCPYIHKGEPGWNESKAVAMPKGAGAGAAGAGSGAAGSGKRHRRSTRRANRRSTRRRQRKD